MLRDDIPISLEQANAIANELTHGAVSVETDGPIVQLVRRGYQRPNALRRLTESELRAALPGWDMWDDS